MSAPIYRPLTDPDEFPLFNAYVTPTTSGVGVRARTFDEYVAAGVYRPDWVFIAERGGEVIARAAFWAPEGSRHPWSVDFFDPGVGPDRVEVGAALLRRAYAALVPPDYAVSVNPAGRPDYHLFLPVDWRERPQARADAVDRLAAAELAGLRFFVERLNLRWTPADGLPPRSTRLRFEPAADRYDELVDAIVAVNADTLDAYARRDDVRLGARPAVTMMVADGENLPGGPGRAWWRLAYTPAGDLVGFVLPTRNPSSATIWYVGVVPAHRGHHYSDDLVAEALHIFAAAGEPQATDNTDVANAPMAASFARSNYRVVGRRMILE